MRTFHRRAVLGCAVALGISTLGLPSLQAQDMMAKPGGFPERPIAMIVPYGPAGGSGQVARGMIEGIKQCCDIDINPDYKPGGSGLVGLKTYMAAPADGYTVLEHIDDATSAFAIGKSDVHPANDLIPLVISQITFSQLYIRSVEDRFSDFDSFIEFCKGNDGKTTVANVSGEGSMERINLSFVLDHFGCKAQQISFDKGAPRYAALKGGQVDALFEQPGDVRGFLDSGDFKPVLTFYTERPAAFADVPTLKDKGMDFVPLLRFRGFYVHKDTPPDRVKYLTWLFTKGFNSDKYQQFNKDAYMDLIPSYRDTEGARKLITETMELYKEAYRKMGLI